MATNETSTAHTPGPWRTDWLGDDRGWILDEQSNYLAEIVTEDDCGFVVPKDEQRANAEFIVTACNAHADLLKLAQDYREACSTRIDLLKEQLADEHEFSGDATEIRDQIAHWKAARKNCDTVIARTHGNAA